MQPALTAQHVSCSVVRVRNVGRQRLGPCAVLQWQLFKFCGKA